MLYAGAAARREDDAESADEIQTRACASIAALTNPDAMVLHQRRLAGGILAAVSREDGLPWPSGRSYGSNRQGAARLSAEQARARDDQLVVTAFGLPRVSAAGRVIGRREFKTLAAQDMLFLLVDHPQGVSTDRLMETFWPDADGTSARGSLHSTAYRLRRALGDHGAVRLEEERYALRWPGEVRYDVGEAISLIEQGFASCEDELRAQLLAAAVVLARADYLDGVASPWCVERRLALDDLVTRALLDLGETRLRLGEGRLALRAFRDALKRDPLREEGHRGLMRSHMAMGNRAMALRQFEECRCILERDLGAAPIPQPWNCAASWLCSTSARPDIQGPSGVRARLDPRRSRSRVPHAVSGECEPSVSRVSVAPDTLLPRTAVSGSPAPPSRVSPRPGGRLPGSIANTRQERRPHHVRAQHRGRSRRAQAPLA